MYRSWKLSDGQTIEIPATQRTIAESVTCDLCGTVFNGAQPEPAEVNWGKSCHDINRTAISVSKGYGYADCGYFLSRLSYLPRMLREEAGTVATESGGTTDRKRR